MLTIKRARSAHLALWLLVCLWLAEGWRLLVWPTRLELLTFSRWAWVIGLIVFAALWVTVIFRSCTGGSRSPWSSLFPNLQDFYWGKLLFQPTMQRELLVHLTVWGITAGWLALQGYQLLGGILGLLATIILLAITIAIYWLRAWLIPAPHG
ncbi:MAG: hypothetical protein Q8N84_01145 [bacterium]|nr:hypothetical protein [bacterium]